MICFFFGHRPRKLIRLFYVVCDRCDAVGNLASHR